MIDQPTKPTQPDSSPQSPKAGRRPTFRWPGLEISSQPREDASAPHTRQEELALAEKEAATREEKYGGEADLFNLKFDVGPDGPHTTIDFDKFERGGDASALLSTATVTTSDFLIYNKIKKLMMMDPSLSPLPLPASSIPSSPSQSTSSSSEPEPPPISIVDLKFSQTGKAVFFVTAKIPIKFLKKLFQN